MLFKGDLDSIIPHISDCSFSEHECSFFGDYGHFFLRLRLSRGTIIAANIGQAMVNLELWLSKSSSLHRQPHGGRGLISQSLACESHTLPLGHHATKMKMRNMSINVSFQHFYNMNIIITMFINSNNSPGIFVDTATMFLPLRTTAAINRIAHIFQRHY